MPLSDELLRHPELRYRNHCYKVCARVFFLFLKADEWWEKCGLARGSLRHYSSEEHTHTVLGISGPEASRVLGAERIKLPRWPVSKFRKAFKVPVAFLPFRGAGGMYMDREHRATRQYNSFRWYLF